MERRVIWKFVLTVPLFGVVTLQMPRHSRPLSVGESEGALCLWAEVDPDLVDEQRDFIVRGTGHVLTGEEGRYIGTAVMLSGNVWHVYDQKYLAA